MAQNLLLLGYAPITGDRIVNELFLIKQTLAILHPAHRQEASGFRAPRIRRASLSKWSLAAVVIWMSLAGTAGAETWQSHDDIRATVVEYLQSRATEGAGRSHVDVGALDPRLPVMFVPLTGDH